MNEAISHRGPDAEGYWDDPEKGVYIAHKRLSVLDIECGSQPMWTADGSLGISFNGEIYNHLELREILQKSGHRFLSHHSDTEVLLHGYREWGPQLPQNSTECGHLRSMIRSRIVSFKQRQIREKTSLLHIKFRYFHFFFRTEFPSKTFSFQEYHIWSFTQEIFCLWIHPPQHNLQISLQTAGGMQSCF
jgi:hypothetical protein